jgi:hypothetical protein
MPAQRISKNVAPLIAISEPMNVPLLLSKLYNSKMIDPSAMSPIMTIISISFNDVLTTIKTDTNRLRI